MPDTACKNGQGYRVKVALMLTNKVISVTNTFYGSVYLGTNDVMCVICHSDKLGAFSQTHHATAFARKINGSDGAGFRATCISCHSLGYDVTAAATNAGFDDVKTQVGWNFPTNLAQTNMVSLPPGWNYSSALVVTNMAGTNWAAIPAALQGKANVQCEGCHGPADRHMRGLGDTNSISISLSAGNCGFCHDSMTHHSKNYEWSQTPHAIGPLHTSSSCLPCHTTKGFIDAYDPGIDFYGNTVVTRGTLREGITCVTCHDPHTTGRGEYQLRSITSATLMNNVVITNGGDGIICMKCHRSRQRAETYVVATTNSSRFGPHHGPQTDLLAGTNAVEYAMKMPTSRHLSVVTNSCVECHMQETPGSGSASHKVGGHTFSLRWDAGTPADESDDVLMTETCAECHGEIEEFNFGGEDYDRDGVVEGVQNEIEDLLETLALLLPPDGPTVTENVTPATHNLRQRKALFNYLFVEEDRSRGVHNPKYAAAILQASLDDLMGGIDVDRDGLLDSWEIANFTDLGQNGSDDWDGDGASNAIEMAAGTDPKATDSDLDGYSDLLELQGGSNPLSAGSTLMTNYVSIVPAVELMYLPSTTGVTQRFQVLDSLVSGSWTNVGPTFVSSNAWYYQLWSIRGTTQSFFRVITAP